MLLEVSWLQLVFYQLRHLSMGYGFEQWHGANVKS